MTTQKKPNFWLAVLLLWACVIPGVVYLVNRRGTETDPFSIRVSEDGEGSRVLCTGAGAGYRVAYEAMRMLPTETEWATPPPFRPVYSGNLGKLQARWDGLSRQQKLLVGAGGVALLAGIGWLMPDTEEDPVFTPGQEQLVEQTKAEIRASTSCRELQQYFDTAEATFNRESKAGPHRRPFREAGLIYMRTADERMEDVGCYDR